jgi:hypothetical protein
MDSDDSNNQTSEFAGKLLKELHVVIIGAGSESLSTL